MNWTALVFVLIRAFGGYLDGRVGRGRMGWWSFHLFNWLRRDVPMIALYGVIVYYLAPQTVINVLLIEALFHLCLHHIAYLFGEIDRTEGLNVYGVVLLAWCLAAFFHVDGYFIGIGAPWFSLPIIGLGIFIMGKRWYNGRRESQIRRASSKKQARA